ncbi:MAG: asparaginase [Candidatus Marinimicrobia bacterium]|nr:asparaginase [Candidatus Neomarinimicrobiota bacterium]
MKSPIKIFITGGTFDKEYNELTGKLLFKKTHLFEMLEKGRCHLDMDIETLMMVDSLEMTESQRNYLIQRCQEVPQKQIVITHGTDTLVTTAGYLGKANIPKTIILTGAMIPYKFGSSDGMFNLGSALSFVQILPNGVFIAMNGRYFKWDCVRKNTDMGVFEETTS